jgi:hypothetical protein
MSGQKGRKGRPVTGLWTRLQEDYKVLRDKLWPRPIHGKLEEDIYGLELAAANRAQWLDSVKEAFPEGIG